MKEPESLLPRTGKLSGRAWKVHPTTVMDTTEMLHNSKRHSVDLSAKRVRNGVQSKTKPIDLKGLSIESLIFENVLNPTISPGYKLWRCPLPCWRGLFLQSCEQRQIRNWRSFNESTYFYLKPEYPARNRGECIHKVPSWLIALW